MAAMVLMANRATADKAAELIEIDSLEALAEYSQKSNVSVRLAPGTYRLEPGFAGTVIELPRFRNGKATDTTIRLASFFLFSGNNSHYDLSNTVIEIDGNLHRAYDRKTELHEAFVTGHGNTIDGLTLRDDGDVVPAKGVTSVVVIGNKNTLLNTEVLARGSYPYGYGHLLGKGGPPNVVHPRKHCGILISGLKNKLIGAKVYQYAYGHGIFLQGAVDTLIQDCYVEGELRSTNEMLAETDGPAHKHGFKSIYPPGKITPNRIIALAEDGIRTYSTGGMVPYRTEKVTVIGCTIKNMRGGVVFGFEKGPSKIIDTTTIGHQERGFSIGTDGVIKNSRGDAANGPLLTFLGPSKKNATIELEIIDTLGEYPVPRVIEVNGTGHTITLKNAQGKQRDSDTPIFFGSSDWEDIKHWRAPDTERSRYSGAYECTVINQTGLPIVFTDLTRDNRVVTNGEVIEDRGKNNRVKKSR